MFVKKRKRRGEGGIEEREEIEVYHSRILACTKRHSLPESMRMVCAPRCIVI